MSSKKYFKSVDSLLLHLEHSNFGTEIDYAAPEKRIKQGSLYGFKFIKKPILDENNETGN
jgi:hypothetical protein